MLKRIISLMLAVVFTVLCSSTVLATDLMQDSSFYYKQSMGGTCTLTSAAMMLRRRAYLDGNAEWTSITEQSVRPSAWSNGLSWNFTYSGMNVQYGTLNTAGSADELIALLAAHPEGIVAYNRNNPHAVLLTDYTDGVFYCADPAGAAAGGRIPFSACTIAMSGVSCYWYIANAQAAPIVDETQLYIDNVNATLDELPVQELSFYGMFVPENLCVGSKFNLGGILKTPEGTTITEVTIKIIDATGSTLQEATNIPEEESAEWAFRSLNSDVRFGQLSAGDYAFSITAKNSDGTTLSYARAFTVSGDATSTTYYWTALANEAA